MCYFHSVSLRILFIYSRLGELRGVIANITTESNRRTLVQKDLVACLRKINKMINTAASLRCTSPLFQIY